MLCLFESGEISHLGIAYEGIKTGDNDRFLRNWFEVSVRRSNIYDGSLSCKWQKTAKAGEYRSWYGSHYVVTNFENEGEEILASGHGSVSASEPLRSQAITWNRISSGNLSFRMLPEGFLSNMGGLCFYLQQSDDSYYLIGFLNSSVAKAELDILNPTMSFPPGTINAIAVDGAPDDMVKRIVSGIALRSVEASKDDWDSFESSWNFKRNALI